MYVMNSRALEWKARSAALTLMLLATVSRADTYYPIWNAVDCTEELQYALDDAAFSDIVIRNVGQPWRTHEIVLRRSNVTIWIEPGVTVSAQRGANGTPGFDPSEVLIKVVDASNVSIIGYGATLSMPKDEYTVTRPCEQFPGPAGYSEWRHAIAMYGCSVINIAGLQVLNAGGDGMYFAGSSNVDACSGINIRDCRVAGSYRNGISFVSVNGATIDGCEITSSGGQPRASCGPWAGIDIEPNSAFERASGISIKRVNLSGNDGSGLLCALYALDQNSASFSIDIENALITNCGLTGVVADLYLDEHPGPIGSFKLKNVLIESVARAGSQKAHEAVGMFLRNQSRRGTMSIENTVVRDALTQPSTLFAPILIDANPFSAEPYGNISFTNCVVYESDFSRHFLRCRPYAPQYPAPLYENIRGNFHVFARANLGAYFTDNQSQNNVVYQYSVTPPSTALSAQSVVSDAMEGTAPFTFRIRRTSSDITYPFAVALKPMSGTATNRVDYPYFNQLAVIPAGAVGQTSNGRAYEILPRADDVGEMTETVQVAVAAGRYWTVSPGSATPTMFIRDAGASLISAPDQIAAYLAAFGEGRLEADVDDGSRTGIRDEAVTIDDLIYFLEASGERE